MKCPRQTEDVDLRNWRLRIRFLFRIFAGIHGVTERTRMRAIKCLGNRRAKGHVPGELDDHRCPSHRLQGKPMQTDCATERENRDDAAGARKHNEHAGYRLLNVNASSTSPEPGV